MFFKITTSNINIYSLEILYFRNFYDIIYHIAFKNSNYVDRNYVDNIKFYQDTDKSHVEILVDSDKMLKNINIIIKLKHDFMLSYISMKQVSLFSKLKYEYCLVIGTESKICENLCVGAEVPTNIIQKYRSSIYYSKPLLLIDNKKTLSKILLTLDNNYIFRKIDFKDYQLIT